MKFLHLCYKTTYQAIYQVLMALKIFSSFSHLYKYCVKAVLQRLEIGSLQDTTCLQYQAKYEQYYWLLHSEIIAATVIVMK